MKRILAGLVWLLLAAVQTSAQELDVTKIFLGTSPNVAVLVAGSGSPEGVVAAPPGSPYFRTDDGTWWRKASGTGATGWVQSGGVGGSGTTNTLPLWTGPTTLGDSYASQESGNLVVGAHLLPSLTDTYDVGRYDRLWNQGYLSQLNAILFALETQTLFGGWSTVGANAGTFAAVVGSGDTQIDFGKAMNASHFVVVRAQDTSGAYTAEYMQVVSLVSGTTYNVSRNLSGLGAKNWAKGTPWLLLGWDGTGRIDLFAYDGKPRITFTQQGTTYNAQTTHGVVGNMNGYYGYGDDQYGAAFGSPTGTRITMDNTEGLRLFAEASPTGARVTVDATNGIRLFAGGTNNLRGQWAMDGSFIVGSSSGNNFYVDASGNMALRYGSTEIITASNAGVFTVKGFATGGAGNLIHDGDFTGMSTMPSTWSPYTDTGLTQTLDVWETETDWSMPGKWSAYSAITGTPAVNNTVQNMDSTMIPVVAGRTYEASAYLGQHRGQYATVQIIWRDNAGAPLSGIASNQITVSGGNTLAAFGRACAIGTAPAGAYRATLTVSQVLCNTGGGACDGPYVFMVQPFFGEAGATQTTCSGYSGGTVIHGSGIRTGTLNADRIVANSITASQIAASAITTTQIAANTITAGDIAAGTITTAEIAANTITAGNIAAGTITTTQIAANTITAGNIAANTITGDRIASNAIDTDELNAGAITAAKIAAGAITGDMITGGTIDGVTVIAGAGDEITLNSTGVHFSGSGGNATIDMNGVSINHNAGTSGVYVNGNLAIAGNFVASSGGVYTDIVQVADELTFVNMPSSTGTAVIWETTCGCLKKDSSSLRYKENVRSWSADTTALLQVPAIRYDYRGGGAKDVVGLAAEDLFRISPDLVNQDARGEPDSVRQQTLNAYVIDILRTQRGEIAALRERVAALERRLP